MIIIIAVLVTVSKNADIQGSLSICRGSILLREHTSLGLGPLPDYKAFPILCKTHELEMPEKNDYRAFTRDKGGVERNIAERIADCWWEFGEGTINKNVFGENTFLVGMDGFFCFDFTINNLDEPISAEEMYDYLLDSPYKVKGEDRPYCSEIDVYENENGELPADKKNCIKDDAPECEQKGGSCESRGCDISFQEKYSKWGCKNDFDCCVKKDSFVTYSEYIHTYNGPGRILFHPDLTEFKQDEEYSIVYIIKADVEGIIAMASVKGLSYFGILPDEGDIPIILVMKSDADMSEAVGWDITRMTGVDGK